MLGGSLQMKRYQVWQVWPSSKKRKKHFKATKDVKTNCTPTSIYNDEHGVEKWDAPFRD